MVNTIAKSTTCDNLTLKVKLMNLIQLYHQLQSAIKYLDIKGCFRNVLRLISSYSQLGVNIFWKW